MAATVDTQAMAAPGSSRRKLISPEDGKAAIRSDSSSDSGLPARPTSSATRSQGIMPLSQ